jgi:hypothetical protein
MNSKIQFIAWPGPATKPSSDIDLFTTTLPFPVLVRSFCSSERPWDVPVMRSGAFGTAPRNSVDDVDSQFIDFGRCSAIVVLNCGPPVEQERASPAAVFPLRGGWRPRTADSGPGGDHV